MLNTPKVLPKFDEHAKEYFKVLSKSNMLEWLGLAVWAGYRTTRKIVKTSNGPTSWRHNALSFYIWFKTSSIEALYQSC